MRVGKWECFFINDVFFRLDGGAMFGVVPKVLWSKKVDVDKENRILMASYSLLLVGDGEVVLLDAGLGDKLSEKEEKFFAIERKSSLLDKLRELGFKSSEVTKVVLSHLHFDHCGWATRSNGDGRFVPTFENATYFVSKKELERALFPEYREKEGYDKRNFLPLLEKGCLVYFENEIDIADGVRTVVVPGHTLGMSITLVNGGDRSLVFWADLVPMSAHLNPLWTMSFDLYPMMTMENKYKWLRCAVSERWISVFQHDPFNPVGQVIEVSGKYKYSSLEEEVDGKIV